LVERSARRRCAPARPPEMAAPLLADHGLHVSGHRVVRRCRLAHFRVRTGQRKRRHYGLPLHPHEQRRVTPGAPDRAAGGLLRVVLAGIIRTGIDGRRPAGSSRTPRECAARGNSELAERIEHAAMPFPSFGKSTMLLYLLPLFVVLL